MGYSERKAKREGRGWTLAGAKNSGLDLASSADLLTKARARLRRAISSPYFTADSNMSDGVDEQEEEKKQDGKDILASRAAGARVE